MAREQYVKIKLLLWFTTIAIWMLSKDHKTIKYCIF